MHKFSTKHFRIPRQPIEALQLLLVAGVFAVSIATASAEEVERQSVAGWRNTLFLTSSSVDTTKRLEGADSFVSDDRRAGDAWLQPGEDELVIDEVPYFSDQLTAAPSYGLPDSVDCWHSFRPVCADSSDSASPPTGSEFIASMQTSYPNHHYKFSVNQTFSAGAYPYLEGTLTGPTQYSITILLTSKSSAVENGSVVAYLDVLRQPTHGGGYGWAEHYSVPIIYEEGPIGYCFGDPPSLCVCGNGSLQGSYIQRSCSEEEENFDYLFRLRPADEDQGFSFHAGVAYLGYFQ